jgi:glycosyltransferase involved in cell wall biosynthesis
MGEFLVDPKNQNSPKPIQIHIKSTLGIVTCSKSDLNGLLRTLHSLLLALNSFDELVLVLSDYNDEEINLIKETSRPFNSKVLVTESEGIYAAMNMGAEKLKTEFVLFLNGGDELINGEALQNLVRKIGNENWGYGSIVITKIGSSKSRKYSFNRYSVWPHRLGIKYVPHPATVIRRAIFSRLAGFDVSLSVASDQGLMLSLAQKWQPVIIRESISRFYLGGESTRTEIEINENFKLLSNKIFGPILSSRVVDNFIWSILKRLRLLFKI